MSSNDSGRYNMLLAELVFILLGLEFIPWTGSLAFDHVYSDTFAVQVHGGREEAERLAVRHGFLFQEHVRADLIMNFFSMFVQ